jgi:hypothetical protein
VVVGAVPFTQLDLALLVAYVAPHILVIYLLRRTVRTRSIRQGS